MSQQPRIRIGDLLVQSGKITEEDLQSALASQKESGDKIGKILVSKGHTTETVITNLLAKQLKLPTVDLINREINMQVAHLIPEDISRKFRVLAIDKLDHDVIFVAMSDPSDIFALDELDDILEKDIQVGVLGDSALNRAIDQVYRGQNISHLVSELSGGTPEADFELGSLLKDVAKSDAPVAKLLQAIFDEAVESKASDIHIEPVANGILIRQRIDGMLNEQVINDSNVAQPLTSRLKLMADLNISERRVPQDGRFSILINKHAFDVRLSTLPAEHGESVVLRLLDQSNAMRGLSELGFTKGVENTIASLLKKTQGLILVTGPTGSGKTTSLYSMINALNTPERKIITVEDPVEYRIHRVTQVHVNDKVGLSFPAVLKSCLRQDPDVILVGEMRDLETASIGIRAAMTGHLVLSTLHTNDTVSAITRLVDLGVPYFLIATSLQGILAQRLVRRVCDNCKTNYTPDKKEELWLSRVVGTAIPSDMLVFGQGCDKCNYSGYNGRIPIHELLIPSAKAIMDLQRGDLDGFTQNCLSDPSFAILAKSGALLALKGETSLSEVMKVAGDSAFKIDVVNAQQQDRVVQSEQPSKDSI